jgi:hypothetical protein
MPSHDPARKRGGWRVKPRVRVGRSKKALDDLNEEVDAMVLDVPVAIIGKKLKEMAPRLWAVDYEQEAQAEREALADLGLMEKALELRAAAPISSYAARNLQRHPEQKLKQDVVNAGVMASQSIRQANQQRFPFTTCARSVAMLMHRLNTKDWLELQSRREVLSKPTTVKLVKLMMACRPEPGFEQGSSVALHIFDQCYKKKGESRGKHRAAERVDATGDLVDLISMVIINSITIPVPRALLDGMSTADMNSMVTTGPYLKPFEPSLIPVLQPDKVKADTYAFMKETGSWMDEARSRFQLASVTDMKVAHIARAALGRPDVDGGRTYMNVNKPLLRCDTRGIDDGIRIVAFLESLTPEERQVVMLLLGDGQSMMTLCYLKRRFPDRYRHILICCGHFHAFREGQPIMILISQKVNLS